MLLHAYGLEDGLRPGASLAAAASLNHHLASRPMLALIARLSVSIALDARQAVPGKDLVL